MGTLSEEVTLMSSFLSPFSGVNPLRKEFAPLGADSFVEELTPFWKGSFYREANYLLLLL